MSLLSSVGNWFKDVGNDISNLLNIGKTQLQNIVGKTTTSLSNIWSGGFTGMSESGMAELKSQLSRYCDEVQDLIDGFDQRGDIASAFKGDIQEAAYDFIAAIKELLQAYVSTMRKEIEEVEQAYQNFIASGQQVSQNVQSAASEIRANANNIRLD